MNSEPSTLILIQHLPSHGPYKFLWIPRSSRFISFLNTFRTLAMRTNGCLSLILMQNANFNAISNFVRNNTVVLVEIENRFGEIWCSLRCHFEMKSTTRNENSSASTFLHILFICLDAWNRDFFLYWEHVTSKNLYQMRSGT